MARKKSLSEETENKRAFYILAKRMLQNAINRAKTATWTELVQNVHRDPWGLLYKFVLKRLRRSNPTFSELLEDDVLESVLGSLFPRGEQLSSIDWESHSWAWNIE